MVAVVVVVADVVVVNVVVVVVVNVVVVVVVVVRGGVGGADLDCDSIVRLFVVKKKVLILFLWSHNLKLLMGKRVTGLYIPGYLGQR